MTPQDDADALPQPELRGRKRWAISLIWLVPAVAVLVGGVLVVRSLLQAGPSITITFKTAEGIEAGKTEVKYKDVPVGKVRKVALSEDRKQAEVTVDLVKRAAKLAVADTRFWVVRPRIDMSGVSGLGTLLSGSYIGVDVGRSTENKRDFAGLEVPPAITSEQRGQSYRLRAGELGSLDIGARIYYRRIPVGRVVGYELEPNGRSVLLQVFIDKPYDRYVTRNSRFYNASGVDVSINASGLKLNTQSLASVISGGVAFQNFPETDAPQPAAAGTVFTMFDDRASALAPSAEDALRIRMRFYQSTRGLSVDAPLDFQGMEIGRVRSINLDFDRERRDFWADVEADVYPRNLGRAYETWKQNTQNEAKTPDGFIRMLVGRGLHAQLRTGNLLTGQLYVSLDFQKKNQKVSAPANLSATLIEVPTVRGEFDQIQEQIVSIAGKLDSIPFDQIGNRLNDTLGSANQLIQKLDGKVIPELQATLDEAKKTLAAASSTINTAGETLSSDSGLQRDLRRTMEEVENTARSLRVMADYLQRHPESLLRGRKKTEDPLPPAPAIGAPALAPSADAPADATPPKTETP